MSRMRWLLQEQPWTPFVFLGGASFLVLAHFLFPL